MKPELQAPQFALSDASLVAFARSEPVFEWNWHYHPEFELTWIGRGSGTRLVGDHSEKYGPGDLVLLGPNLPHTWFSSDDDRMPDANRAIVVLFRSRMFPESLLSAPEFSAVSQLLARSSRGLRFPESKSQEIGEALSRLLEQNGLERWLGLAKILERLASFECEELADPRYRHQRSFKLSYRLERVMEHVQRHCCEEVSMPDAARAAGLSPSAFSRFFRKMTGKTYVRYRNTCRVREACRMLTETDLPVTEIAYSCGFSSLANFNRRFREEKHMVPSRYRQLYNPPMVSRAETSQ